MLRPSENDRLTRVDKESAAGQLLRCYWHPVAVAADVALSPMAVRVLAEDLVVYRGSDGGFHAIAERCIHRGASLSCGWVEDGGIRCPYHGWLFSPSGECIERPFEAKHVSAHATAYPVAERAGLLFVYMGSSESSVPVPDWDILTLDGSQLRVDVQEILECNWLQLQENAADVTHTYFTHSYSFLKQGIPDSSGFNLPMIRYGFQPFEFGLLKSWTYVDPESGDALDGWGNLLVFPNILRLETEMHWRVPVDLDHTMVFILAKDYTRYPLPSDEWATVAVRRLPARRDSLGAYVLDNFYNQDAMVCETQGGIADRSAEHLGSSDVGVTMFRRMFLQEMSRVESKLEPDMARPTRGEPIDLRKWMGGYLPMSAPRDPSPIQRYPREEIFDSRHRAYPVPPGKAGVHKELPPS